MRVYYNTADGTISHTIAIMQTSAKDPPGDYIEVADQDLGDLTVWRVVSGALEFTDPAPYRKTAIRTVNAGAGEVRALFVTDILGQEMLYKSKEAEARAYVVLDPEPATLDDFPLISAEVGITAPTALELAELWIAMAAQWTQLAAAIEGVRLSAIAIIEAATVKADIDDAVSDAAAGYAVIVASL